MRFPSWSWEEQGSLISLIISSLKGKLQKRHSHCSWKVADLFNGTEARDSQEKGCLK
jgi:hypothetical protein